MRIALNLILLLFLSSPFGFASDSTKVNKEHLRTETLYRSSHLIQQSGFGIKKGESYYQNINLNNHFYVRGLRDGLSLTVGLNLYHFFLGTPVLHAGLNQNIGLTNKLRLNLGLSASYLPASYHILYPLTSASASLHYGDANNNLSIGLSTAYMGLMKTYHDGDYPSFMFPITLAGKVKLTDRHSLWSEFYSYKYEWTKFDIARRGGNTNKLNEGYVYAIGVNRLNKRNVLSLGALYLFNNNMEGFWNNFGILVPVVSLKVPIS